MPLSELVWKDVSDYVVEQFCPSYIELSKRLEDRLRIELERHKKDVKKGQFEGDVIKKISDWLNTVVSLREEYSAEVSNR